jgi:hypothetical protein
VLQVLVDADNVAPTRLLPLLALLPADGREVRLVVSGRDAALARVRWPGYAEVVPATGWQRADLVLAAAYRPGGEPLVVVSGDGDFALLAARHDGPVLVVSEAASARLRDTATVIDPVHDGMAPLRRWLDAVRAGTADTRDTADTADTAGTADTGEAGDIGEAGAEPAR